MADKDQYEHYNYDEETQKQMNSGHSGKQRSKKEAEQHTNQHDVGGHTRKTVQKLQNNAQNQKEQTKAADS